MFCQPGERFHQLSGATLAHRRNLPGGRRGQQSPAERRQDQRAPERERGHEGVLRMVPPGQTPLLLAPSLRSTLFLAVEKQATGGGRLQPGGVNRTHPRQVALERIGTLEADE